MWKILNRLRVQAERTKRNLNRWGMTDDASFTKHRIRFIMFHSYEYDRVETSSYVFECILISSKFETKDLIVLTEIITK